ncbi:MAG: aspartate aminotransferase family protein [Arcobacter sp.]|nr:aspartate aminotransferase family protein [Arcobacter sp.]
MASEYILQRDLKANLPVAVRGEGIYIYDENGKKYFDGSSGAAVSCLGHSNQKVKDAIIKQLSSIPYSHTSFLTSKPTEKFAKMLINRAPDNFEKVYFLSGGTEAVETALKLVRQYHIENNEPQRKNIIARKQSYHGNTLTTLSVGGNQQRKEAFLPYMSECMHHIDPVYAYRLKKDDENLEEYGIRAANLLEEKILQLGVTSVAAFIYEPIVGSTLGSVAAPLSYYKRIREICDKYGVILVSDEIMCGYGRTGYLFTSEYTGIKPDLITLAKGIAGGYQALAATLVSSKIYDAISNGSASFSHGHTYIGHSCATAAGVAVLKEIEDKELLTNVQEMGKLLKEELKSRFSSHSYVGDVRGKGLFVTVELVKNKDTKECFDPKLKLFSKIKQTAKEFGLLCYAMGGTNFSKEGDHVLLAPPFIINKKQVIELVDKLELAINKSLDAKGILCELE